MKGKRIKICIGKWYNIKYQEKRKYTKSNDINRVRKEQVDIWWNLKRLRLYE